MRYLFILSLLALCFIPSCKSKHHKHDSSAPAQTEVLPFEALPPKAYVKKIKTLLTGLAPTAAEVLSVESSPEHLRNLIDEWTKLPSSHVIIERFFANAFEQSQVRATDFTSDVDDGESHPNTNLVENFRQSFGKTVNALLDENRLFTDVFTTHSFMMTTAMMMYYAYTDTSMRADATPTGAGKRVDRLYNADQAFGFRFTSKTTIPLEDSVNTANPNYMTFTISDLPSRFSTVATNNDDGPTCSIIDPIIFDKTHSVSGGGRLSHWLYSVLVGGGFNFIPATGVHECKGRAKASVVMKDSDYSDWRMVTISGVDAAHPQTRFFDIPSLRAGSSLTLNTPRVGYYTTPAFFAQFSTNISNQARGIINQTMIVGLGHSFDGSSTVVGATGPGADPAHASMPACKGCHANLDPMRRFFRAHYSLNFGSQDNVAEQGVPGTFIFDSVIASTPSIEDLGHQIVQHPGFKIAWTRKLCSFINSSDCNEDDPELIRVANVFASSGYEWNVLVRELLSSPLTTYAKATATATSNGAVTPLARRTQFCSILENRLNIPDICGLSVPQSGKIGKTIPSLAAQIPSDQYSRGQKTATYLSSSDPFSLSTFEKVCALAADKVVDAKTPIGINFTSANPKVAIDSIVKDFMGIPTGDDLTPIQILTNNFNDTKSSGATSTIALKSTFTLACLSPALTSIAQ
ncbi:MAG: hypothetical protein H7249_17295 [Chitinophagaceae bacterium]|nr:hypothetical protein [Oligoflexus sp.]